jgi:hypothetical protein
MQLKQLAAEGIQTAQSDVARALIDWTVHFDADEHSEIIGVHVHTEHIDCQAHDEQYSCSLEKRITYFLIWSSNASTAIA